MRKKWDLTKLYKNEKDTQIKKDIENSKKFVKTFEKRWSKRTDWLKEPQTLKKILDEYEKFYNRIGFSKNVDYYLRLRNSLDQDNIKIKAEINKLHDVEIELVNKMQFLELRLGKIPKKTQKIFLNSELLSEYRHFLERVFESAKHHLSEDEERILNAKSKVSHSNWVSMLSRLLAKEEANVIDEDGENRVKNFSEIMTLLKSTKKACRDSAAEKFNEILAKHVEVAENEMNSILENKKVNDKLRKFSYPEESRHLSDDIDTETVNSMVRSVTESFDIAKEYYRKKAALLKVDKLKYHERNVPIGELSKTFGYKEATRLVSETFHNIDSEFGDIFDKFLNEGHIDTYPKKGKISGAFCAAHLNVSPVYILLNFNNKVDDIRTIAHEAGHGINFELMKAQNSLNFDSPLSTAEVASTFFEDFIVEKLTKLLPPEEQVILKMQKLNDDISTIFRQIAAYNFESELHREFYKKGYLSYEEIGKLFKKHMKSYMGDFVSDDPGCENWWVYWSHFRNFFYVYTYSSGLLISKAMQDLVKEDKSNVKLVKEFLSAGSVKSPKDLFADIGIDISEKSFWLRGIEKVKFLLDDVEV